MSSFVLLRENRLIIKLLMKVEALDCSCVRWRLCGSLALCPFSLSTTPPPSLPPHPSRDQGRAANLIGHGEDNRHNR